MNTESANFQERSVAAARVAERFENLSTDEILHADGSREQLIGLIMLKTGRTREDIEPILDELNVHEDNVPGDNVPEDKEEGDGHIERWQDEAATRVSAATGTLRGGVSAAADRASRQYAVATRSVSRHPAESVSSAFAVGLITGIAIGLSIAGGSQPQRQSSCWRNRWLS